MVVFGNLGRTGLSGKKNDTNATNTQKIIPMLKNIEQLDNFI